MQAQEKFSRPIKGDPDAVFMSVQEVAAEHVAKRLKNFESAVELCTAVGVMAIQLARYIPKVYGVDINSQRVEDAWTNARLYGVDKVEFIVGDVLNETLLQSIKADVAVLDPDWSAMGTEKSSHTLDLDKMQPSLRQMMILTRKHVTPNTVARVPKMFTLDTMSEFGPHVLESIYIDGRLKFKVAYFLPGIQDSREEAVHL